jgi:hypothetical protein
MRKEIRLYELQKLLERAVKLVKITNNLERGRLFSYRVQKR